MLEWQVKAASDVSQVKVTIHDIYLTTPIRSATSYAGLCAF